MELLSLGYQTDLIFPGFDGEIVDRGDYFVIRTPANPEFYWGNFLLFAEPPQAGDYQRWQDFFLEEIGGPPEVRHQTFGWDSPEGEEGVIGPFIEGGFRLNSSVVLTSNHLRKPEHSPFELTIHTLKTEQDWIQAIELQVLCREPGFDETSYLKFRRRQMVRYQKMTKAGLGNWFGAFIGDQLVADLGIFMSGRLGRYQSVETHPDYRRRGIGGTLVYEAGQQLMAKSGVEILAIVAEEGSNAARLYEAVGFSGAEKQLGLEIWDED